ncbi:hypothetical protein BU23DRAFT_564879 [Bimuria novae-zelandiae CBS 107.79]|uniref:MARVEL domain-containing protein n=1 Tax=Bimuria novae-zelandiae CBS 107.79 TaxID=1447943 RepID=A0A6A5VLE1_9PLEO|nr:hypothetical protein BU23DRAFT_564879 [Bimuria novae-zelandiae CBS 107.79]
MAKSTVSWEKRVLLSSWTIRICLLFVILIGFSAAISLDEEDARGIIRYRAAAAFLACTILVLLLDVVQIVLWYRDMLHPTYFVGLTVFQAIFWGLVLTLDIVSIVRKQQSSKGIGMVVVMFLFYLVLFIYALLGYMRQRKVTKRGHYAPAHNSKASVDMKPYSGTASEHSGTAKRSTMHEGGALGKADRLIHLHDEAAQDFPGRPTKAEDSA